MYPPPLRAGLGSGLEMGLTGAVDTSPAGNGGGKSAIAGIRSGDRTGMDAFGPHATHAGSSIINTTTLAHTPCSTDAVLIRIAYNTSPMTAAMSVTRIALSNRIVIWPPYGCGQILPGFPTHPCSGPWPPPCR